MSDYRIDDFYANEGAPPMCEHEHCGELANAYTIEGYDPAPTFYFCDEHAAAFGFCLSCGAFIGGTEDVFLVGREGLCFDCFTAERREYERSYDYGDDDDDR